MARDDLEDLHDAVVGSRRKLVQKSVDFDAQQPLRKRLQRSSWSRPWVASRTAQTGETSDEHGDEAAERGHGDPDRQVARRGRQDDTTQKHGGEPCADPLHGLDRHPFDDTVGRIMNASTQEVEKLCFAISGRKSRGGRAEGGGGKRWKGEIGRRGHIHVGAKGQRRTGWDRGGRDKWVGGWVAVG